MAETLKPKGMKSDYSGSVNIIGNGRKAFGLKITSKGFTIIHD